MTKTQRLIKRIKEVDNFENVAYVCEDFQTFCDEVAEWVFSQSQRLILMILN